MKTFRFVLEKLIYCLLFALRSFMLVECERENMAKIITVVIAVCRAADRYLNRR